MKTAPREQDTNTPPAAQHGVTRETFYAWAHHDSVAGHARNAQCLLALIEPGTFTDPETVETLHAIARRLAAIVEISERPRL